MRTSRLALLLSLPTGLLVGLACREVLAPRADPEGMTPGVPSLSIIAQPGDPMLPVALRAQPTTPMLPLSQAFGEARISFLAAHPADPMIGTTCVVSPLSSTPGITSVALCGQVHNPDGQTFISGSLFEGQVGDPSFSIELDGFSLDAPTSACLTVRLQGTLLLPDAFAAALRNNPGGVGLAFQSLEHPRSVVGVFGPGPGGPPTTPQDPLQPQDPMVPGAKCSVTLTTN